MPSLLTAYKELKKLLKPYESHFSVRSSHGYRYELWSDTHVIYKGKDRGPMCFATLIVQGTYVGFYFMPIYAKPYAFRLSPRLSKMKTGKSCFHVKEMDEELEEEIKKLLKKGLEVYKRQKWV